MKRNQERAGSDQQVGSGPFCVRARSAHICRAAPGARGYRGAMTTCDFCGRQETEEAKTLSWTVSVENGRRKTYCDECSRTHLRAMEGKLDSEFW